MSCAESVFCNSGAETNESAIKLIKKFGNTTNESQLFSQRIAAFMAEHWQP